MRLGRLLDLGRTLFVAAGLGAVRFPVACVAIVAFAAISNALVSGSFDDDNVSRHILAALIGGGFVSVATTLGVEGRVQHRMAVTGFSALAAILVGAAIGFSQPFPLYAPSLSAAALVMIPLAPFIGRGDSRRFWIFSLWAVVGVVLAFFSVLIFLLGVTAILEMIRYLFRVGLGAKAYEYLFTTALTLVGPLFALGRIPEPAEVGFDDASTDRLSRTVRPLFEWVTTPLVLATAVVLHVYAARIATSGEMPSGEVGWIVPLFIVFVVGLRLAMDPFLASSRLPRFFGQIWAWLLIVPTILLVYAVFFRVDSEGFTAARYFLALGALATAVVLLLQAVPRARRDIRHIAATLPILLTLSTVGPWGVAQTVGRSQEARIARVLDRGEGGSVLEALDQSERQSLRSRLRALDEVAQLPRVRSHLKPEAASSPIWSSPALSAADVAELTGLSETSLSSPEVVGRSVSLTSRLPLDLNGYDRAVTSIAVTSEAMTDAPSIGLELEGKTLSVRYGASRDRFDLDPVLAALANASDGSEAPATEIVSPGGKRLRLRVESATIIRDDVPIALIATILLREDDWNGRR